jgi:3-methylfumaryl-CoA hydratase
MLMVERDRPYTDWIGSVENRDDDITLAPIRGLCATLDSASTIFVNGNILPPMWHWLYFLPQAPMSEVDADGHPKRGGFLPPISLPRRMFAGGRLHWLRPVTIGKPAQRIGTVLSVQQKHGTTGHLVFVTVSYRILQDGEVCIEEEQDIVYRESSTTAVVQKYPSEQLPVPSGTWSRMITPDPVLLFRFSALTFNSHRIHYDRTYATNEEGYPGLVVHGPLIAVLLMDLVRRHASRPVVGYNFRGKAPLFDLAPFWTVGKLEGNTVMLEAIGPDGTVAMTAAAELG